MTEHDELMAELGAALDVEPSPAFAAGVRARVDRSRRGAWWAWGSVAAACASIAVVIAMRPATESSPAPVSMATASVETPNAPTAPGGAPSVSVTVPTIIAPRHARPAPAAPAVAPARLESAEPKLEVITNQPELLRELWQRHLVGAVTRITEVESRAIADITVAPIEVEPIVVPKIVVNELVIRR